MALALGVCNLQLARGASTVMCDWFQDKNNYFTQILVKKAVGGKFRVATAQGKQGIWLLTFPDRENTGNLVNLVFYTGKIVPTQGKF